MRWNCKVDNHSGKIEIFEKEAPRTVAAIKRFLPLKIGLRYAKIAGQEVFGIVPFILPLENTARVSDLEPGTVAYYPDRQVICIYHGKVQPEEALVSVIGRLVPSEELFECFESVKNRSDAILYLSNTDDFSPRDHRIFSLLDQSKWRNFWEAPVPEISDLVERTGQTMPAGPIVSGCGDALKLIGVLWEVRKLFNKTGHFDEATFKAVTGHFIEVIGGWYGLKETAEALGLYVQHICKSQEKQTGLDEMILFAGRLHMWIDALIPWEEVNEVFVKKFQQSMQSRKNDQR